MNTDIKQLLTALFFFTLFLFIGSYLSANIHNIKQLNPNLDEDYILELDEAFGNASAKYNIEKELLIAMAFLESSFESGIVGDGGKSFGLLQVGKQGRRKCGYDETVSGQIDSGACWLNEGVKWCGSIEGALTAFACGVCSTSSYRCNQAVKRRLKLAERLKNEI